jgi:small subunit ribosomal protein S9
MNKQTVFYRAIGKRKTSIAKVQLEKGSGAIVVNKKSFDNFFSGLLDERDKIKTPFILANINNEYDIHVQVSGGGISSQLDAICLAVAKALCLIKAEYRNILNKNLLLRRDARIKERRKYGLKKARKASQYSKR